MSSRPKYPGVVVKVPAVVVSFQNVYGVINRCAKAMTAYGVKAADVRQFRNEATAGDWDHTLATAQRWVAVRF